jgi:hypothetical protein
MARTRPCTPDIRRGRLRKSAQFLDAAGLIAEMADEQSEIADVCVTLCVNAGTAASDVICCARLGQYPHGEDHNQAVELLSKADARSAKQLRLLLAMKAKAAYSHAPATPEEAKRAARAAEALVETARRVSAG